MRNSAQLPNLINFIMSLLEEKENEMMANTKKFANENAAKRIQPEQKTDIGPGLASFKVFYVNAVSVLFILIGIAAFIGGCFIADDSYKFNIAYFFGGILSAVFCFGWAAVTRVCALYIRDHDK